MPLRFAALTALVVTATLTVSGCGMTRARWQLHRDLLEADRLADDGAYSEAYAAYEALAPAVDRADLLGYVRYRLGLMLEMEGRYEEALDAYASVYKSPQGLYDHTAGQALFRSAEILRDVYGADDDALAVFQSVIETFPNTFFADDALYELIDIWRERGQSNRLYAYLTNTYAALANTEIADNLVYWTARVLQDDLGRLEDAIEVYRIVLYNFHPSGLMDDSIWRTAQCYRALDRVDEEYWVLSAFIDAREVSWVMADYESEYYRPALYRMAEIHEDRGELRQAIAVYHRFQDMYPLSLRRDDVQFRVMELQVELGDLAGVRESLEWLRDEYPDSRFIRQGEALLADAEAGGAR